MKTINRKLLKKLKEGDDKAFERIYQTLHTKTYGFILSLLFDKSLTEDLTQSVFLKIWEKRKTIDETKCFESYVFTIARNLVYDETKKKLYQEIAFDYIRCHSSEEEINMEAQIDLKSLKKQIIQLINQLPPARREIFQMSRLQYLSNKQIALHLNLSERTIETQIYRSLKFLKERISYEMVLLLFFFI